MRPRAEKLWDFLSHREATEHKNWFGTYAELSGATKLSKKEVAHAVTDLEKAGLVNKINHGRAGIELNVTSSGETDPGYGINNCGWCGAKVGHPDFRYCTSCGRPLQP